MGLMTPPQTISPPPHTSLLGSIPPKTKRRRSEDLTPAPECPRLIKRPRLISFLYKPECRTDQILGMSNLVP